jgi:hypothetical protein
MSRPGEWIVNNYAKNFEEIWVPDFPDRGLTGKMTESSSDKIRFVGYLSDQIRQENTIEFQLAVILSGPEPQRTRLEDEVLPQLQNVPGQCAFARGVISDTPPLTNGNLIIYPYLDRAGVNRILNTTDVILCRTGYSSLMDLMQTGTKAILIPTPGQPEQVYLGEQLKNHPQFVVQKQGSVDVVAGVRELMGREVHHVISPAQDLLSEAIVRLEEKLTD